MICTECMQKGRQRPERILHSHQDCEYLTGAYCEGEYHKFPIDAKAKTKCFCGAVTTEEMINRKVNVMPEGQGQRTRRRPRHDLIPVEFLDMIADIFEEGLPKYEDSWMLGGVDFLTDCLNHASNHFHRACGKELSVKQLAKVAWNVLVVAYHIQGDPNLIKLLNNRKNRKKV